MRPNPIQVKDFSRPLAGVNHQLRMPANHIEVAVVMKQRRSRPDGDGSDQTVDQSPHGLALLSAPSMPPRWCSRQPNVVSVIRSPSWAWPAPASRWARRLRS